MRSFILKTPSRKCSTIFRKGYIKHFCDTYADDYPPSWMMIEGIMFGTASRLYKGLCSSFQETIADKLNLPKRHTPAIFEALVVLRNMCAHHSRIWNQEFGVKMPYLNEFKKRNQPVRVGLNEHFDERRLAYVYLMLCKITRELNISRSFRCEFHIWYNTMPEKFRSHMGFKEANIHIFDERMSNY
jgi:abortive infection bacteriophage resistance protein